MVWLMLKNPKIYLSKIFLFLRLQRRTCFFLFPLVDLFLLKHFLFLRFLYCFIGFQIFCRRMLRCSSSSSLSSKNLPDIFQILSLLLCSKIPMFPSISKGLLFFLSTSWHSASSPVSSVFRFLQKSAGSGKSTCLMFSWFISVTDGVVIAGYSFTSEDSSLFLRGFTGTLFFWSAFSFLICPVYLVVYLFYIWIFCSCFIRNLYKKKYLNLHVHAALSLLQVNPDDRLPIGYFTRSFHSDNLALTIKKVFCRIN